MEPFAKMKPVNYFCKILHIRYLTGFWMHLLFLVHIWEFECPLVCFKDWVFLTHFKPPFHSYWKQIDWFRHEKESCLEWVKKWLKCFEKHRAIFLFFLVKLLKYLTISAKITCSKSTIKTLEERIKICPDLTLIRPERRHWRRSGLINVKSGHILLLLTVFLLLTLSMFLFARMEQLSQFC